MPNVYILSQIIEALPVLRFDQLTNEIPSSIRDKFMEVKSLYLNNN